MFANEHAPPHFHAYYQGEEVTVEIESGAVDGKFSPRALHLVQEWREMNKEELMKNWNVALGRGMLSRIKPLE